jgi:uncharacterized membrane protein
MTRSQKLLAGLYCTTGALHFAIPEVYEKIMPDYLPAHRELVLVSGAAELAGGIGVAVPRTRRAAGWGLAALLVAVFPANLHMALHPERYEEVPAALLWARLPLQPLAIWWALRSSGALDRFLAGSSSRA